MSDDLNTHAAQSTEMAVNSDDGSGNGKGTSRSWVRRSVGVLVVAALTIALLPQILAVTGLFRPFLAAAASKHDLRVSAQSASLSWVGPVSLDGFTLERQDDSLAVFIPEMATRKTLLSVLTSLPDVGRITVDRPEVTVTVSQDKPDSAPEDGREPKVRRRFPGIECVVRDASVAINSEDGTDSIVDFDGISATARTEHTADGNSLTIDPVVIFDRRPLTPKLCNQGLQLIAPVLAENAMVTGTMTVELKEFRFPLDPASADERNRRLTMSGQFMLHDVETGLKTPLLKQIAAIVTQFVGVRVDRLRVANETRVDFNVEEGRVFHDGLTLVIPEISDDLTVTSSGWVDLNENVQAELSINLAGLGGSLAGIVGESLSEPLKLEVTGTLKNPKIRLPQGRSVLDEIAGRLSGGDIGTAAGGPANVEGAIVDVVDGIIGEGENKPDIEKTARGIFGLIKAFQKEDDDPKPGGK